MDLSPYTKKVEDCRKRWNRQTLRYVVEVARIVRRARRAAKTHGRWCRWIKRELRMARSTIHRYLKVEAFLRTNVASLEHLENLSIVKVYGLSLIPPERVAQVLRTRTALRRSDRAFMAGVRGWIPRKTPGPNPGNLISMMNAALLRVEETIRRWREADFVPDPAGRARLQSRILAAEKALHQVARGAAAM
jgi:hypothetical protein